MSLTNLWVILICTVRTEEPGVLQSMGLKRVGHDQATEQQQNSSIIDTVNSLHLKYTFKSMMFVVNC